MAGSSFQPPINLNPDQDPSQQIAFINQNFQQLASSLNPYIVSDGTTNRIILGKQPDGTYGLKISQSGVDVATATNSQLIFNSSQDIFKIVSSLTVTVTATAGNQYTSASTAHGLSFTPAIQAYIQVPASLSGSNPAINHANPAMIYGTVGGVFRVFALCEVTVDSTNVNISVQTDSSVGAGTYTFTAKVYLLQETFS